MQKLLLTIDSKCGCFLMQQKPSEWEVHGLDGLEIHTKEIKVFSQGVSF